MKNPSLIFNDANILMDTNYTNIRSSTGIRVNKLIYPELSYTIVGVCFDVHNELGRFAREKQYCDALDHKLQDLKIPYKREFHVNKTGNIVDFIIDDKLILELKAKRVITKDDYYQIQRYLQILNTKLGLLVNFRNRYLKAIRIVRIDTDARSKFV